LTTNRVLLFVAVVMLVVLAFASALEEVEMNSDTGGAARDWVALLIVPLALAGVGYVTPPTRLAGRRPSRRRVPKKRG
jgi:hypothetical protein